MFSLGTNGPRRLFALAEAETRCHLFDVGRHCNSDGSCAIFFFHLVNFHAKHGREYTVVSQRMYGVELFDETVTHGPARECDHEVVGIDADPH